VTTHKCCELVAERGPHSAERLAIGDYWRCGAPSAPATCLPCPAGRRDAVAGPYCEAHGGATRAQREAEADWLYVAPASVGSEYDVQNAGCAALCSEHVYVVVRAEGTRYTVALGIGSHTTTLRGSHASAMEAEKYGRAAWATRLARDTETIRVMRGGTLAWGMSIAPREAPIVLHPATKASAWDALPSADVTP